jgi:hypothetical protein
VNLGESTPGESEGGEFETPEARIAEVVCGRRSVGGTRQIMSTLGEREGGEFETPRSPNR